MKPSGTLAVASVIGEPPQLHLQPFGFVPALLARLRQKGGRLSLISNTGELKKAAVDEALIAAGLASAFDADLRLYSGDFPEKQPKPHADLFLTAKQRSTPDGRLIFVGENSDKRRTAEVVGFETVKIGAVEALLAQGRPIAHPQT